MAEVCGYILNFLKEKIQERSIPFTAKTVYQDNEWFEITEMENLFEILKKSKNITILTPLGEEFYLKADKDNLVQQEDNVKEALINIHKHYGQMVRGENSGIWKSKTVVDGFASLEEKSLFDEYFTKGLLQGILKKYNCIAPMVKQIKSHKDEEKVYYNLFEMTWMKKVK